MKLGKSKRTVKDKRNHSLVIYGKSQTWCVTIVTRGLSRFSQDGICPLVTMKIFRTQGACLSIDRSEYLSSSLSSKRLAETSSSCLDWEKHLVHDNVKFSRSHLLLSLPLPCSQGALTDFWRPSLTFKHYEDCKKFGTVKTTTLQIHSISLTHFLEKVLASVSKSFQVILTNGSDCKIRKVSINSSLLSSNIVTYIFNNLNPWFRF